MYNSHMAFNAWAYVNQGIKGIYLAIPFRRFPSCTSGTFGNGGCRRGFWTKCIITRIYFKRHCHQY